MLSMLEKVNFYGLKRHPHYQTAVRPIKGFCTPEKVCKRFLSFFIRRHPTGYRLTP